MLIYTNNTSKPCSKTNAASNKNNNSYHRNSNTNSNISPKPKKHSNIGPKPKKHHTKKNSKTNHCTVSDIDALCKRKGYKRKPHRKAAVIQIESSTPKRQRRQKKVLKKNLKYLEDIGLQVAAN